MFGLAALTCLAQDSKAQDAKVPDQKVERGRYLVQQVARCHDCHTPRLDNGDYVKSQMMKGTTLSWTPVTPLPNWRAKTPDVTANSAVMKRWGADGMIKFLETGKTPRGGKAEPPMPAYTLSPEDAEAVVAYLNSIQ